MTCILESRNNTGMVVEMGEVREGVHTNTPHLINIAATPNLSSLRILWLTAIVG
jgi:hypothetical protein